MCPTPKITQQEMAKRQLQPKSAFCPSPGTHSASLAFVLSIQGQEGKRGGPWPSEATGCGKGRQGPVFGRFIALAHIKEQEEQMSQ